MIFEWYTHDDPEERLGSNKIANQLNELGYPTYTNKKWVSPSVLTILKNAVYAGRIQWRKREYKKSTDPYKRREARMRPQSEWVDVKGKHEPLVALETFQKAQEILRQKYHVPYPLEKGITNPLAGLIQCDLCGATMVLRPYSKQQPHLICYRRLCQNKSSRFSYVEQEVYHALENWLHHYQFQWNVQDTQNPSSLKLQLLETSIKNLQQEMKNLEAQKERLHDLLERRIYEEDTFLERSQKIAKRIHEIRETMDHNIQELTQEKEKEKAQTHIIPQVKNVLEIYPLLTEPKQKNALLKKILEKCTYRKEKWQKNNQFTLKIYPKI
jgi:site-specific DNA recombinase